MFCSAQIQSIDFFMDQVLSTTQIHTRNMYSTLLNLLNHVTFIPVASSDFFLDFPTRQTTSFVETVSLPSLTQFTFCFWMKQCFDGSLRSAIMSYATTEEVKSLWVLIGSSGGLNLRVMDSRYKLTNAIYK